MNYKIILTDVYLKKGIDSFFSIEKDGKPLSPENLVGNLVIVPLNKMPLFFESILDEKDFSHVEYSWILFGEVRNDDNEIFVPKGQVGFSVFEEITLIDKKDFFHLCVEFAEKAIEAVNVFDLKDRKIVDDEWIIKINELIPKLKKKYELYMP
ncbi:MAG: hypothetical protein ACXVPU_16600 [Bacteroidia bacterium]